MFYICSLQTTNILYVHILKKESVFHYHSAKAFIDNPRQSGGFILQKRISFLDILNMYELATCLFHSKELYSPMKCLTSGFEMGPGVTTSP